MQFIENEIWKDIKGYEGIYQVSNIGRVKSLDREIVYSNGRIYNNKSVLLKPNIDKDGYERVSLCINQKSKSLYVHRLVFSSFVDEIPLGFVINHINGIPNKNNVENLECVNVRENTSHYFNSKIKNNIVGVTPSSSGKFRARVTHNGKEILLGVFANKSDANKAYNEYINKNNIQNKYATSV